MGMSTHVVGIRPPDDKWQSMYEVWKACEKAGVAIPEEVDDFFEGKKPHSSGVIVKIPDCIRRFVRDTSEVFEIDLRKLPEDVFIIQFSNDY